MFVWHWFQQHRLLAVLILSVVILSSAGGTAWALVFRTVSSPVGLREALRMYRREQADKILATLRGRLPAPGVYSYRTSGGEGLSLLGVSRSFPSTTPMIVSRGSCATVSWVPVAEHTETTKICRAPAGALRVPQFVTHESIAGTTTTSTVDCPATAYLLPPSTAGRRWTASCTLTSPVEKVGFVGQDLGPATVTVGGSSVKVEHTRVTLTFSGSEQGTSPADFWVARRTGLIVREKEAVAVTSGGVHYSEHMVVSLTRLQPSR